MCDRTFGSYRRLLLDHPWLLSTSISLTLSLLGESGCEDSKKCVTPFIMISPVAHVHGLVFIESYTKWNKVFGEIQ